MLGDSLKAYKFADLFAGIGGFHLALSSLGAKCSFASEIDEKARLTYLANFKEANKLHKLGHFNKDITNVVANEISDFDILCGGFPCQPFSVAGYMHGFQDTRGTLFFDILRILKEKKPKVIFLENVKNLKSHDNGNTIKVIYHELSSLGYSVSDAILNTMEHGNLPQNRERIYIVGFLNKEAFNKFQFPEKIPLETTIQDCLEKTVDDKYYYNEKSLIFSELKNAISKKNTAYQWRRKYVRENKSGVCPTLTANMGMGGHNVPLILDDMGIRKLTPRECANFQGYPQKYRLQSMADSHLYKQLGNTVSISVIKRIAENISLALQEK